MKKICDYIKDKDVYGHPVLVTFDNDGPTHKTFSTGLCSLLTKGLIWWYAIRLV